MSAPDSQAGLPRWARRGADGMIEVDPDQAYPLYLGLLGVADARPVLARGRPPLPDRRPQGAVGTPLGIRILARLRPLGAVARAAGRRRGPGGGDVPHVLCPHRRPRPERVGDGDRSVPQAPVHRQRLGLVGVEPYLQRARRLHRRRFGQPGAGPRRQHLPQLGRPLQLHRRRRQRRLRADGLLHRHRRDRGQAAEIDRDLARLRARNLGVHRRGRRRLRVHRPRPGRGHRRRHRPDRDRRRRRAASRF